MKIKDKITKWVNNNLTTIIGMYIACLLSIFMLNTSNNYRKLPDKAYFNRIELIDSMQVVNTSQIQAYKDSLLMVDIHGILNNIESKLDILNSRPIPILSKVDTLYVVATRPVEAISKPIQVISNDSDSLVSVINSMSQKALNDQIRLVQYQDSVNTNKGIIADRIAENEVLAVNNVKQRRHTKIFAGTTFLEALYIGLRSARVF